jgi:hypothetical protein
MFAEPGSNDKRVVPVIRSGYFSGMILRAAIVFLLTCLVKAAVPDTPFLQDRSEEFRAEGELAGATLKKVHVNKDGVVYVLTDRGMARLFEKKLALDQSFRPLIGKKILDSTLSRGEIFYLLEDRLLCNGFAGTYAVKVPTNRFDRVAVADNGKALVSGPMQSALIEEGKFTEISVSGKPFAHGDRFWIIASNGLYEVSDGVNLVASEKGIQSIAVEDQFVLLGTTNGITIPGASKEDRKFINEDGMPWHDITSIVFHGEDAWIGTTRGIFREREDEKTDYYASRRWLLDDYVIDAALDAGGNAYVLTKTGLNKIVYEKMTLEDKAVRYQKKIRDRHIRFGFCSELYLSRPGDIASAQMIDTDNDGTWSNYYMASMAFRFGATGDPEARDHAWETFAALERLEKINPLGGFPARTFEREGFRNSDPDRWHIVGDGFWEWKAHTSSDEITAHCFGSAALYECVAKTDEEKARIATFISKIVDHIIRNNWYLIDVDKKPTLWARWNPEYVNWFPHTIGDRRLNSAEIVALLQFAHAITGKEAYRQKGMELLNKHGYLENILSPMSKIAKTPGFLHQGNDMGNEWNHSDDLLGFVAYYVLYKYAFNDELRAKYAGAIRDHWEIEKDEKNPFWNAVYASVKGAEIDTDGMLWILRRFPLDMTDWTVINSHRGDITKLPENFRGKQLEELLPPGERRITRWNGHPFVLDGGNGGHTELAGDEFLLPYWLARYLNVIGPGEKNSTEPAVSP